MKTKDFSLDLGGRTLKVSVGGFAPQAHGSVTVSYGETVVLATVVQAPSPREGTDFFPLTVDYEERLYAAGKIKGSRFIKREGRASDEAILTARVIDRSIRPLFGENERRDTQVVCTVLSWDQENDPDLWGLLAASLALQVSPIPWQGPLAGVRVGRVGGEWVLNPTYEARIKSDLDVFVAATDSQIVMLEGGASQVPESEIYEAIVFGHKHVKTLIKFCEEIIKDAGAPKRAELILSPEDKEILEKLETKINAWLEPKLKDIFSGLKNKKDFSDRKVALEKELDEMLKADNEVDKEKRAKGVAMFEKLLDNGARKHVLETGTRVDGRGIDEIRALEAQVGLLPRTHGSGLFQRGETQVLSVVTLGSPGAEQTVDGMEVEEKKRYMHHYNFPGYSVGEVKPMRSPSRREIGHGALAEKALMPVLPDKAIFPYTIRVVSEVMASNGSSSQASTCGSSLALMDAGVPIVAPVAGIAMGLLSDPENPKRRVVLTDIQGLEDHGGDMDFKVAGTDKGLTALQVDIKLGGLDLEVVEEALVRAKKARGQILEVMSKAIASPRQEMSQYAPRIETLHIPVDKIRDLIGPGGKMINEIIDKTGVQIDIEQDGTVFVTSPSGEGMDKALDWIKQITHEIEAGEEFLGTVVRVESFGCFVELLPKQDGLIHISKLAPFRIGRVEDVVKMGDKIKVKVDEIDDQGRLNLSPLWSEEQLNDLNNRRAQIEQTGFNGGGRSNGNGFSGGHDRRGGGSDRGGHGGGQKRGFFGRR